MASSSSLAGGDPARKVNGSKISLGGILREEIDREFTLLRQKGDPAPYFMAFEAVEEESHSIAASFGALTRDTSTHSRGVDTTVRVGSPAFDNFHPFRGSPVQFTAFRNLSLDNNPDQIRRTVWLETDRVYRLSSQRYSQLRTDQQLLAEDKETSADFTVEQPEQGSKCPAELEFDGSKWAPTVRAWSSEFRKHPGILTSSVAVTAHREVRTLVNTEGTTVESGSVLYRVEAGGVALADDGMEVSSFDTIEATDATHLPEPSIVQARIRKLAASIDALRQAPPAEPIVCPAILSGRAAAVFFHEIFGHRMEGHRQKNVQEGQTFTASIGRPVLPQFLTVESDPTRKNYNGADLIGAYDYDDEGVRGRPVNLVEGGVLKTFLLSRSPVGSFVHSNGHGRRQPGREVVSRQANLLVKSANQVRENELRQQLISEIKRQNKPYGLYFEEVASGVTSTNRRGMQVFRVVPIVVYRVFPDGRPDELIRGVDIVGTPLTSFQKILATSDRMGIFNGFCGAESGSVPVSAVAPSMLISEIETQKKENIQQRLPVLPRPTAGGAGP